MGDLSLFYNDRYKLLKYLESKEEYIKNEVISKASQDDMAEALEVSKHTINAYIKDLKSSGFIEDTNQLLGSRTSKKEANIFELDEEFAGIYIPEAEDVKLDGVLTDKKEDIKINL